MTPPSPLVQRVRAIHHALRGDRPADRRTTAAILDGFLRGLDAEGGSDPNRSRSDVPAAGAEAPTGGISGAFTAISARRALAHVGRSYGAGLLVVTDGRIDLALLFAPAGLKAAIIGGTFPSIARRLNEKGRIDKAELERALRPGRSEAEGLAAVGVAQETVAETCAEVVGQTLLDALFWSDPQFEARAGEAPAELLQRKDVQVLSIGSRSVIKNFVTGIGDRIDQLATVQRAVPSLEVTLKPGSGVGARSTQITPRQQQLLDLVTQRPGTAALELNAELGKLGLGARPLHILATDLQDLSARGAVAMSPGPRGASSTEDDERALSPLARALRRAKRAADKDDRPRAARHLARAGAQLLAQGRPTEGVRFFLTAHALAPADLESHDGLVRALFACERKEEALAAAQDLVRADLDLNLPARARRLVARCLPARDTTLLHLLHLEALLSLGELRAASEVGERVVGRLRREGRADDADALSGLLLTEVDGGSRDRLLSAGQTGLGHPMVGRAFVLAAVVLGGVLLLVGRDLASRERFRAIADELRVIAGQPGSALQPSRERLAALGSGGDVGRAAVRAAESLARLERDRVRAAELAPAITDQRDIDALAERLRAAQPETAALRASIDATLAQIATRRAEAVEATSLLDQRRGEKDMAGALEVARDLAARYPDCPRVLAGAKVPLRITSFPPGGKIRWGDVEIALPMPLDVDLPVLDERPIEVLKPGHRGARRLVSIATLVDPVVVVRLRPLAAGEAEGSDEAVTMRDGVGATGALRFEPSPGNRLLARLPISLRWRARVDALHDMDGATPRLIALDVTVEEDKQGGQVGRPVRIEVKPPVRRAPQNGVVAPLERAPGLDPVWLRDRVTKAVAFGASRLEGARR